MAAAPPAGQPAGRAADGSSAGLALPSGAAANALAALAFTISSSFPSALFADRLLLRPDASDRGHGRRRGDGRRASACCGSARSPSALIVPLAAFMSRRSSNWRLWAPVGSSRRPGGRRLHAWLLQPRPQRVHTGWLAAPPVRRRGSWSARGALSVWRPPGPEGRTLSGRVFPRETSAAKNGCFVKHPGSALPAPLSDEAPSERGCLPNPFANDGSPSKGASRSRGSSA